MHRTLLLFLLATTGCGDSTLPPTALPPTPIVPTALPVQFRATVPIDGPQPQHLEFALLDGHLAITGRLNYGSAPMAINSVTATDYGDSLVVLLDISGGVFAAVDSRLLEATVGPFAAGARWLRVRSCCQLFRDTVLFAPLPGRRPAGWTGQLPVLQ